MSKNKRSQSASPKLIKNAEHSSSTDPRREGSDSTQSTVQVPPAKEISLPTSVRSRRKRNLKKPNIQKDLKFPDKVFNERSCNPASSLHDTASILKVKSIFNFCHILLDVDLYSLTFYSINVHGNPGRKNFLIAYQITDYGDGVHMSGSTVQLITPGLLKESLWNIFIMLDWGTFQG